jgi:hypothetical protein
MDHIQCPSSHRCIKGNEITTNFSSWMGICICNYHTSCEMIIQRSTRLSSSSASPLPPSPSSTLSHTSSHLRSKWQREETDWDGLVPPDGLPDPDHDHDSRPSSSPQSLTHHREPQADFSVRIAKNIFDALLKPNYQLLLVQPNQSDTSHWDLCGSYFNICSFFLEKIGCEPELRYSTPCGVFSSNSSSSQWSSYHPISGEYLYPHGRIQNVTAYCRCGEMNVLDTRSFELVITGLLSQTVNEEYTYIPSSVAPYNLAISSDPFKQLIQARHIMPLG